MNVDLIPDSRPTSPLGKVVLFFPRFRSPQYPVWLPMEVMTVATALWKAGYRVRVLDDRLEPLAEEILLQEAEGALFVGSSARPGDQVIRTYQVFTKLKSRHPNVVTVFGGWFASTFPEACVGIGPVDIVVSGNGDRSVVELADRLREGRDLQGVLGVRAKLNGAIVVNPRRPLEPIDESPRIPFERFPIERYVTYDKCLSYYTSRGCPAACRFCCVPVAYPREWTGYSAARVVDEMELLHRRFGVEIFKIHDTNFFPDFDRARAICRGLLARELKVRWIVDVRVRDILQFDDEMWDLLVRSGCRELETGGEAGCDRQLERIAKECTSEEIFEAASRVVARGINMRVNFIFGLHGERRAELLCTLRLLRRLQSLGPLVKLQFYRYTPVPTTELGLETWKLVTRGHDGSVPRDAESIVMIPLNHDVAKLFWLSESEERRVKRLYYFYLPLVYYFPYLPDERPGLRRWVLRRLISVARWRVRFGITALPFERWLCRRFGRPMPRTREFEWKQQLC
ncbi:MAG: radical SAM protein [Planctomycetota bacterium]